MKKPDFNNLLKVLACKTPDSPTLFEFFLNTPLYKVLAGDECPEEGIKYENHILMTKAFANAGYDYVTINASSFSFPRPVKKSASTISLNEAPCITDKESFLEYKWQDPDEADYSHLDYVKSILPDGMKIIIHGPSGVLENTINLVGYDNLCLMIHDDPALSEKVFNEVRSRLLRSYEKAVK